MNHETFRINRGSLRKDSQTWFWNIGRMRKWKERTSVSKTVSKTAKKVSKTASKTRKPSKTRGVAKGRSKVGSVSKGKNVNNSASALVNCDSSTKNGNLYAARSGRGGRNDRLKNDRNLSYEMENAMYERDPNQFDVKKIFSSDVNGRTMCQGMMKFWHLIFGHPHIETPLRHRDPLVPYFLKGRNLKFSYRDE